MSDTPETDEQINGKPCTNFFVCAGDTLRDALVPSEFARKLERERDEARKDAKRATYDAAQETIKVSTVKSHWIEACRERDEARRLLAAAKESLNAIHVEVGGWIAEMMKEGK